MEIFLAVLVMLGLIGVSNVVNRFLPMIPVPLIQIALGALVAMIPSGVHLELEPELFFVLFIAPLLYNDGKHTPRDELWRLRAPILLMAVGLVFVTVFAVGYAIHWMIPSIPLAAAFGLAAILSPTDAVAVSSLAGRLHLPKSLMRLLEGEALMNDASGLVAFKFAIAAAITGVFSLPKASFSFLEISVGGLLFGAVLAFLIIGLRKLLRRFGMEDVTIHMLIQLLTPFMLYLTAEHLGVSGILAAVAGGIVHAVEDDRSRTHSSYNQLSVSQLSTVSTNTWSVILFILNGLVFVILGLQIPDVSITVIRNPLLNNLQMFGYAAAIFAILLVLRFLWTLVFTRTGKGSSKSELPSLKILLMTSVSGVRGAVTLAGAFSIPLVLNDGTPFPERDLIIFLAAVVILLSLLSASLFLPLLARRKDAAQGQSLLEEAQVKVLTAAIQAVRYEATEENEAAVSSVIADYRQWIGQAESKKSPGKGTRLDKGTEIQLRLSALNTEREFARSQLDEGRITPEQADMFFRMLDQMEVLMANPARMWKAMLKLFFRRLKHPFARNAGLDRFAGKRKDLEAVRTLKLKSSEAALQSLLEQNGSSAHREERSAVISHYREVLERFNRVSAVTHRHDSTFHEQRKELHGFAIQAERNAVQAMYELGELSREAAGELRRRIKAREAVVLEQDEMA
ncbi:Na+/H+ antiporter [Paenibacillus sp. YN15]|uniref:Na+/H+ antiporter n=1 Tax=Paenibacillus sp. YN15 TaxID=1742774 RepID=UPI000DCD5850|nr:Na+/H+ antiporter [Paenibacillus sp. YN15]RAV04128.1 Na+/H+ antiporter [Paenibacillus sp. YN15]